MYKMKRFFAMVLILALTLCLVSCSGASEPKPGAAGSPAASGTPEYVIKMGHCYALEDNIHLASNMLADLVFERTNGAVKIEVFGGGQLGGSVEQMEAVVNGIQPACAEAINVLDGFVPLADIESYPFLFDNSDQLIAFLNNDLSQELWEEIGGDYFRIMGAQFRGVRMLQTTKPVRQLSDLKGLKLRTANMMILHKPWEFLGCATTPMGFTEIYTGLQQGTIEGQENPLFTSYASGFQEIEKYVIDTRHVYGIVAFVFNKEYFDGLPQEYQDVIMQASKEVAEWRNDLEVQMQDEYIKLFTDAGAEFIELSDIEDWKKMLEEPLEKEFANLQPWVRKIKEFNAAL